MAELKTRTPIECPKCDEIIDETSPGSALATVRCSACGHLLSFDEVSTLRQAEQARMRKYD